MFVLDAASETDGHTHTERVTIVTMEDPNACSQHLSTSKHCEGPLSPSSSSSLTDFIPEKDALHKIDIYHLEKAWPSRQIPRFARSRCKHVLPFWMIFICSYGLVYASFRTSTQLNYQVLFLDHHRTTAIGFFDASGTNATDNVGMDYNNEEGNAATITTSSEENMNSRNGSFGFDIFAPSKEHLKKNRMTWEGRSQIKKTGINKSKLQFMHIPKTGGSSIEDAALIQQNLSWGMNHILDLVQNNPYYQQYEKSWSQSCAWHWPIKDVLKTLHEDNHPSIHQNKTSTVAGRTNPRTHSPYDAQIYDTFTVVRNPYQRIVSEIYYQCDNKGMNRILCENIKRGLMPGAFNLIIRKKLNKFKPRQNQPLIEDEKEKSNEKNTPPRSTRSSSLSSSPKYFLDCYHWVPQYDYVYGNDYVHGKNRQYVTHILHTECLGEEFGSLMKSYGVNVTLPRKRSRERFKNSVEDNDRRDSSVPSNADSSMTNATTETPFDVYDLTLKTIKAIEAIYADDFELGGYTKLSSLIPDNVKIAAVNMRFNEILKHIETHKIQ